MNEDANQTLLFDADDTLWENNIYFEQAIAGFISFLDHRSHMPEQVREHLNACEHATISVHGYGLASFHKSLVACFEQLTEAPITPEAHERIVAFTTLIADAEIELLPDVQNTLAELATRHRLLLVTKGSPDEQLSKLHRSGLSSFFIAAEVVAEKTRAVYERIVVSYGCDPNKTWMIGNSPRSDVNPALAAGLNVVFVPHASTWMLEQDTLAAAQEGRRLLQLGSIRELTQYL